MPEPQTYKNHGRYDPTFHFFILPVLLANLIFAIVHLIHHLHHRLHPAIGWVIVSLALLLLAFRVRIYSLRVQDRIIRLEERLRFTALLPPDLLARTHSLTEAQFVGLRFASDDELPALVKRTLDENLSQKQIKQAINKWRPDYFRV